MSDMTTIVPEAVTELFTLFKEQLSDVVFPDVSVEILENLAASVDESNNAVEEAMKQVEAAQEMLSAAQEELLQKSIKALAYARIYADGNDELLEQLSAIQLGKQVRAPKKAAAVKSRTPQQSKPKKSAVEEVGTAPSDFESAQ